MQFTFRPSLTLILPQKICSRTSGLHAFASYIHSKIIKVISHNFSFFYLIPRQKNLVLYGKIFGVVFFKYFFLFSIRLTSSFVSVNFIPPKTFRMILFQCPYGLNYIVSFEFYHAANYNIHWYHKSSCVFLFFIKFAIFDCIKKENMLKQNS